MRRSFFVKNYVSYAMLILFAFVLAGGAFFHQMDRYARAEKQSQLKATAIMVADQTGIVMQAPENKLLLEYFQEYMKRVAENDQSTILVTNLSGAVVLSAQPGNTGGTIAGSISPQTAQAVYRAGYYSDEGTLNDLLPESSYIVGAPCENSEGEIAALVFVSTPNRVVVGMLREVSQIFIIILMIALFGALIISYFISARMTYPLKIMARASKDYAAGNFAVRVPEDNQCDEIDELAVSFNNMARDLEQLDELTRGFIGNVSHEFKTPMTTIGGFVAGMLDGTIPPEQHQKYLKVISEEVGRLSRMVVRMLDAAKIQSGELILSSAPFDFTEMSSQIVLSFEQKINAKHLDVDISFEDRIMVMGDRDHVFRAVYNLVDNAVKFINDGGRLTLHAHSSGHLCEFSVKNTGAGISPEDISHVFDRFYKTDRSRSLDRTGVGLGLYIVKNIINLHGGDISVRSDGGETEFSLTLPLAPPPKKNALPS